MKRIYSLISCIVLILGISGNTKAITIHTIGDSTMADYEESTTDKRGWGMMFQQFFTSDVTINNRAKSGASSKSFYQEAAYWATVKKEIKSGDYVFIQFAHNDEKNNGLDGDIVRLTDPAADYRGTTAQGTYKLYLRAYINESRELGATPVLVTPMCRKYFIGGTITRIGRHDLGEKFGVGESDHTYDYVFAMKEVAAEMNVQLIDLTALTKTLYESYGDATCTSLLFCIDDSTHPNALGGTLVARMCAQEMVAQNILRQYVKASSDLLINPSSNDFGSGYIGQTLTKEFTVSGFDLTPTAGTFTLSVTDGFSIAINKSDTFTSSIALNYSNGNLNFSRFYINVSLAESGSKSGTLTLTNGAISKSIPLTANCIELTGGTKVKLFWELSANSDYLLTGPAVPVKESWSEMYVQRYAVPNATTIWPAESGYNSTRLTQRNLLVGDAWPAGDIDEVSSRYIQFGIAASKGTELNIDSIGLYIGGAGGNGMRCRISISTNGFADYTAIREFSSMVSNTMYAVSAIPVIKLAAGDSLLLRVYPWYNGAATGKTICLSDVCIHGIATTFTNVKKTMANQINCSFNNGSLVVYGISDKYMLNVIDLSGRRLYSSLHQGNSTISIPSLKMTGIYLCEIISSSGRSVNKFQVH